MNRQVAARLTPEAVAGVLLTAIGGVMLLDRLGIFNSLVRFWPIALVGAGIALLLEHFDNPRGTERGWRERS